MPNTAPQPALSAYRSTGSALFAAMRPAQWTKNLFVLAPMLFGQRLLDPPAVAAAVAGFAIFCALSSAMYLVNDLLDQDSDRAHPAKRRRPIASGSLGRGTALAAAAVLVAAGAWPAVRLGAHFSLFAAGYVALMASYSLGLKRVLVLDCMMIAAGFVLRVVAGAAAADVAASHWLVACAFLLALFLAFSKRRQEVAMLLEEARNHRPVLASYPIRYLDQVNTILLAATAVCYMLYTVAPETVARFGTDALIYGTGFVLYGLLRFLALAHLRTGSTDSLLRDKPLLAAIAGWVLYNGAVIYRAPLSELVSRFLR